jgi:two-component system, sensor histidine kinase and response regulator
VLLNLVGNAVKCTETGEVTVRVSVAEETRNDAVVKFTINDSGIGMPAEAQGRLFQAFSQGDDSITRKYGGTGLGLAISKRLVELRDGTIGVKSTPGEGSTFWFTARLPKRQAPQSAAHHPLPELRGLRVLCVDDNATNRSILEAQLTAWGMHADCVANGPRALAQLHAAHRDARPYALVIVDYQMPAMEGMTLAAKIKTDPFLALTPLVILSSLGERVQEQEGGREWIAASLAKPVRQSQLYDCIARVIGTSAPSTPRAPGTAQGLTESQPFLQAHVLIAEDNAVNQKVAARMLEKLGCRVDVAVNGREAVDALSRHAYDCIFMDCQMPEMDGYEATAAIRQRQADGDARAPIIAMTAHAMQGDRERCLVAGMHDYLSKPVNSDALLAMLQKWVRPAGNPPAPSDPAPATPPPPSPPSGQAPPLALDAAAFGALRALYNDDDSPALLEVFVQFMQDASARIDTMRATAAADEVLGLARAAHGLKSSSASLGALRMATICQEIEQLGQAGTGVAAMALVAQLATEFLRVQRALACEHLRAQVPSESVGEP